MDKETLIKNFFNDLWIGENLEAIERICANNILINSVTKKSIGTNEKIQIAKNWFNAFPKRNGKIEAIVSKEDVVSVSWSSSTTHEGLFFGLEPTGKKVTYNGICYYKIKDNLITQYYSVSNVFINLVNAGSIPHDLYNPIDSTENHALLSAAKKISNANLTNTEIKVMSLWLAGYSIKESSKITHLSTRTIEEYRANAKDKLNIRHKKCLYDLVRQQGLLDIFLHLASELKKQCTKP